MTTLLSAHQNMTLVEIKLYKILNISCLRTILRSNRKLKSKVARRKEA